MTKKTSITRRQFLQVGAATGAAFLASPSILAAGTRSTSGARPNVLLIVTDQQGMDTISAGGWSGMRTPNLDRLAQRGVMFTQSYCTNPVCSPARSSIYTGRTCSETGVYYNQLPIREGIPNLGRIFRAGGYETVYCGKWHMPLTRSMDIDGFHVLPGMLAGQGTLCDKAISSASQAYLHTRDRSEPFLMAVNFLQPHDMCNWVGRHHARMDTLPYPEILDELPPLPPNFAIPEAEAKRPWRHYTKDWTELQWRYYIWSYYRMVEEVDAEIGRVLNALDDSGQADNTLVIFTADHGEGRGRHQTTQKNFLYDAATKVPFIVAWPGHLPEGRIDRTTLVSGLDVTATACDAAGLAGPDHNRGLSVLPLARGDNAPTHEFVAADAIKDTGRMIRSSKYKLITFRESDTLQLFDMENDPNEMTNLALSAGHADVLRAHCRALNDWEASLDRAPNLPYKPFKCIG